MNKQKYDPKIHHRRSIRLNEHNYAGGGVYFVTICAHREFSRFSKGTPFGERPSPVQKFIIVYEKGRTGLHLLDSKMQEIPVKFKSRYRISNHTTPFDQENHTGARG